MVNRTSRPKAFKVGQVYIKTYNTRTVASTGVELFLAGKVIPQYVVPKEYWCTIRCIGDGAGMVPDGGVFVGARAGLVEIRTSQEQVETDDITGDEMIGRYMHPEYNRFEDASDASETDLGVPQDMNPRSSWWKARELFWYRDILALPDRAVFNNADLILGATKFKKHAKIKSPVNIDMPKFFGIGGTVDAVVAQTDWGEALYGGTLELGDLYEAILEAVGPTGQAAHVSETVGLDFGLRKWMGYGYVTSGLDVDQAIHFRTSLTIRCDVYIPGNKNVISPL